MSIGRTTASEQNQVVASPLQSRQAAKLAVPSKPSFGGWMLEFQQNYGNQTIQRLLRARLLQPKLTASQPDDEYEREADRVADQVMRIPEVKTSAPGGKTSEANPPNIQRICSACEEEEMQRRPHEEMSRSATEEAGGEIDTSIESAIESIRGGGQPLPQSTQDFFEPRFGYDFSAVRVHIDSRANELARAVHARAFTIGRDVVFGTSEFAPETVGGQHLLAHELTHVVQQSGQSHVGRQLQRLTVTDVGPTVKFPCGGYRHRWDFQLDSPAPADGYIVQKIEFTEAKAGCDQPVVNATPAAPNLTFWEAWPVKSGDRLFNLRTAVGYTDQSGYGSKPNMSGTVVASGEIKFFRRSVTGNLGGLNVAGTAPDWAPGGEPQSGSLPSTHTEPSWWSGAPGEGPTSRLAQSYWNCCGPDSSQYSNVFTLP